jgi:hypothetical protein
MMGCIFAMTTIFNHRLRNERALPTFNTLWEGGYLTTTQAAMLLGECPNGFIFGLLFTNPRVSTRGAFVTATLSLPVLPTGSATINVN